MSTFERYLTAWVLLCIGVGITLGQLLPGPVQAIGRMAIAQINLPVGLPIWTMVIPMRLKVDFGALSEVRQHWRGFGVTLFVWSRLTGGHALLALPQMALNDLTMAFAFAMLLMNRPIVVTPRGTRLCRPSDTVLGLLGENRPGQGPAASAADTLFKGQDNGV